jgi:hypothetical protein
VWIIAIMMPMPAIWKMAFTSTFIPGTSLS